MPAVARGAINLSTDTTRNRPQSSRTSPKYRQKRWKATGTYQQRTALSPCVYGRMRLCCRAWPRSVVSVGWDRGQFAGSGPVRLQGSGPLTARAFSWEGANGANPALGCSGSPLRRRWFLSGCSVPLLWRRTRHDTDNRYCGPSVERLNQPLFLVSILSDVVLSSHQLADHLIEWSDGESNMPSGNTPWRTRAEAAAERAEARRVIGGTSSSPYRRPAC